MTLKTTYRIMMDKNSRKNKAINKNKNKKALRIN